jgi:hypothetical protein
MATIYNFCTGPNATTDPTLCLRLTQQAGAGAEKCNAVVRSSVELRSSKRAVVSLQRSVYILLCLTTKRIVRLLTNKASPETRLTHM